ncbi:hypothetical protein [Marinoscillum furvescens]|uniref:Uncharacterized protein n=1 Tax=Marinoscillum furvescens DSM 4134 TaxID=1122208 RepID=A0A3D9KXL0_MARFU|nr:hypothetical protein [Marinoscillum furvescens]RED92467.1 hypothetical protein C7460_13035 [Marinoscillum furvescens DSM 4134]
MRATLFLLILLLAASEIFAGKFMFGKDETIRTIQKIDLPESDSGPLFLAYKTTTQYLLLGVYLSDDGYVLQNDEGSYIPLREEELAELQAAGVLSDPLPAYSIPFMDWVWGYSLWVFLIVFGLYQIVQNKLKSQRKTS